MRENGYYWVKVDDKFSEPKWEIACWYGMFGKGFWEVHWHQFPIHSDNQFLEIDECPINRLPYTRNNIISEILNEKV